MPVITTPDGLVGILGLAETGLRGTGDKVNISAGNSAAIRIPTRPIFSYTHPYLNDAGDSIGFSIFDRESEYDDYNEKGNSVAEYDRRTNGFNTSRTAASAANTSATTSL